MKTLLSLSSLLLLALVISSPLVGASQDGKIQRERKGNKTDAQKDAMEGKAPPALDVITWQNTDGKPLTWESLRGKVVVLDFWGVW